MKRAKHPYIVHLNWTFQSEQKLYFVMEYLKGGDFAGLLDSIEGRCLTGRRMGASLLLSLFGAVSI